MGRIRAWEAIPPGGSPTYEVICAPPLRWLVLSSAPRFGDHPASENDYLANARSDESEGGEQKAIHVLSGSGVGEWMVPALVDWLSPRKALDHREQTMIAMVIKKAMASGLTISIIPQT